jgi:hypothetical protein
MRQTLHTVLVLLAACTASGLLVEQRLPLECEATWDVSSQSMYDLAYKWTHARALADWKYVNLQSSEPGCVQVSYTTTIKLLSIFREFMPSQLLHTQMLKKVCASGPVLQETLVLRNIILIDTVRIDMNATIHRDDNNTASVLLVSETEIPVPWYLNFLYESINKQVEASLRRYHRLIAESLCSKRVDL